MKLNIFHSKPFIYSIISLLFLVIQSDIWPLQSPNAETEFKKIIKEGNGYYANGEYDKALVKFHEAKGLARSNSEQTEVAFSLSLTYYAAGDIDKVREHLESLFKIQPGYIIEEISYPQGFINIFNQIRSAILKLSPEKELPPKWLGKPGEKPVKKGKSTLLIIGGIVLATGIITYFLLQPKAQGLQNGDISINSTPPEAHVYLDGQDTGKTTPCSLTNIKAGTHQLKVLLENYGKWEGSVEVKGGQTVKMDVTLGGFKYEFVTKWGSLDLDAVAIDNSNYIYASSLNGNYIIKFTNNGGFVNKWGTYGFGDGQFRTIFDIAVDNLGYVYVVDFTEEGNWCFARLQKFYSDGRFVMKWGSYGKGDDQFTFPAGIVADGSGFVYVKDSSGIKKFTADGRFILKWGSGYGDADGQFKGIGKIAVDNNGYVYVADRNNHRIQKFTSNGSFVMKWGNQGTADGQFSYPEGVATDSFGYVYIADTGNNRIQKFTSDGRFMTKWGSTGSNDGQFGSPTDVAVDRDGYVYVADRGNSRIQKFRMTSETKAHATITYAPIQKSTDYISFPSSRLKEPVQLGPDIQNQFNERKSKQD